MSNTETTQTQTRCLRCHRTLRATRSLSLGYGAGCRARIRDTALTESLRDFTPAQADKARDAVADGALIATSRPGIYQCVSSDGTTVYLAAYEACTCPAGTRGLGRKCWHRAAVRLLAVSRRPVRKAA